MEVSPDRNGGNGNFSWGKWKFLLGKFPKTKISPRNNSNLKKNEQKRLFFPRFPTRENRISPDWLGGNAIPLGGNTFSSNKKFRRRWEKFRNISNSPENPISPWEKFQQTLNLSGEEKKARISMQQKEKYYEKIKKTDNRPMAILSC